MSTPPPIPRADATGGTILVVDDHEPNRVLLADILEMQGYAVLAASSGEEALERIRSNHPDLILLDVNMPGVDGLEVCRRLRADPATTSLPIILVTSLTHREHRLEGIAAGANDYLTKPIDRTDLLLRVRNALHLRKLHRELTVQYDRLRRLEELRDSLVHMVVHDLRSPLTGITGFLDLIRLDLGPSSPPTLRSDLDNMSRSVRHMTDMVNTLLDVSRLESEAMPLNLRQLDLGSLASEAVQDLSAVGQKIEVRFQPPASPVVVRADADLIRRVVGNLVANAIKFTPTGGMVRIEVDRRDQDGIIRVTDTGPGIPAEHHAMIFEKFGQAGAPRQQPMRSSGLGLTFCKLAVEAHHGRIGVESEVGRGSTFWLALPMQAS